MDLSTESDCHFMLSKILYVRWEEFEIFLLRNTQVVLGIQSSLRWGWQGGTAAVAMTMAGSLQRHCTRFKSNPCKSQNPVQCSKNSDKIPNYLLISNLKKHHACKKGMQVVRVHLCQRWNTKAQCTGIFLWTSQILENYMYRSLQTGKNTVFRARQTISTGKNPQSLLSPNSTECWRMTEMPGKGKG